MIITPANSQSQKQFKFLELRNKNQFKGFITDVNLSLSDGYALLFEVEHRVITSKPTPFSFDG